MYAAVPAIVPSAVSVASAADTSDLARPKSSSLAIGGYDAPWFRVTRMFPGLRSRCRIPCRCAASSAVAICTARRSHFLDAERTVQRGALHVLEHQIAGADIMDLADVRMIQRRNRPRLLLEAADAIRVGGKRLGEDLDRHVTTKTRVARAIHLAHAAGADQRDDFIRANLRAQREWHDRRMCRLYSAPRPRTRARCVARWVIREGETVLRASVARRCE